MSRCSFSVVIPCKNERHFIGITLKALQAERESFGLIEEVIVVDNGSTDDSVAIAESMGATVLHCQGTISAVRNLGASRAKGDYLAFIDADIEVRHGWSQQLESIFTQLGEQAGSSLVGYPCDVPEHPSWIEAVWFSSLVGRKSIQYIGAANLAVSKLLFDQLGGFDESLFTGEDVEFCARARSQGKAVILDPRLQVVHHGYPKSLRGFYGRERWHGVASQKRGGGVLGSKAGWLALAGLLYPPVFVIACLLGLIRPFLILSLLGLVVAVLLCARRLKDYSSLRPLQLCVLFVVYTVARAHSLLDSLLSTGKAKEYSNRQKEYSVD